MAFKFAVPILLVAFFVVLNGAEDKVNFGCPDSWYAYNNNCYYFETNILHTAEGAAYRCDALGAKLLNIESPEEFMFAEAIASSRKSNVLLHSVYIGLDDKQKEGDFVWSDGRKLADSENNVRWEPNQPNDSDESQNCVVLRINNGNINDVPCSFRAGVFCKKELGRPCKMGVRYTIIFFMFSIISGLEDGCISPQYLQLGNSEMINCLFEEGFYGVFWYGSSDTVLGKPILEYVESKKGGPGYMSREFDISPNGSLIINNVAAIHDREFAVLKFQSKTDEDPFRFVISVIATGKPSPPYPVIGECGNTSQPCFVEILQPSPFNCFIGHARPPINLTWVAPTVKGDFILPSESFITNDSVRYTSRVETTESFFQTKLLTLLCCKAKSLPEMLTTDKSFLLVQNVNSNFSFPASQTKTTFVELESPFRLSCNEHDFLFLVWKKKSSSADKYDTLLYSILFEAGFTKSFIEDFSVNEDGSLVLQRVGIQHEGLYSCIYSEGVTNGYVLHNVIVYVNPTVLYPIVEGCNEQQRCVKEVTSEGNLTCSVSGIRPEVELEWVRISGSSSDITFTNKELRTNKNRDTFDIIISITYHIHAVSKNRLTVKCQMTGPNSAIFSHATTVDLLFVYDNYEETQTGAALILAVVIPLILVILLAVGIVTAFCRRHRHTPSLNGQKDHVTLPLLPNSIDFQAKKEMLISQLKGKYEDLYSSIRPIPHIFDNLHCVNEIFVEGEIRVVNKMGGKWNRLDSYKDILNEEKIKSTRYILEGEPGIGKSTLSLQLAYDWCNGIPISSGRETELFILLRLRQLGGIDSIYMAIRQFLLPNDSYIKERDIQTIVETSKSSVIVLDGYDEYPEGTDDAAADIYNIIDRKMLQQFPVILTTRVGCLPKRIAPITKFLRLNGFDEKARERYINKVFIESGNNTVNNIQERLKENPFLAALCEIPLFFAMFVHVCHHFESPQKFKTVTSFFRHSVSCFHSHLKNKMNDENVKKIELFETHHGDLDKLAFESLTKKNEDIVWDRKQLCSRTGEEFYEQYRSIGMLVEERIQRLEEKPGKTISDLVQNKTYVRFYHNLFREWYAAHYLVQFGEKTEVTFDRRLGSVTNNNEINLDYLDPINHQYVFRFACGLSSVTADKIFQYLKSRYGGDRFETLCILEKTGEFENIKSEIVEMCSSPVTVHDDHTKLQQRSTIQLLEIASSKQIPIAQLRLENCFSAVDITKKELQLKLGIAISNLYSLKELHIEASGTGINGKETEDILLYCETCESLETLTFVYCIPPQNVNVESLHLLRSRNVRVTWETYFSGSYCLNLESGFWQHEDGTELTDDEYNEVSEALQKPSQRPTTGSIKVF